MGNSLFNSLFKGLLRGKEVKILILGLDGAGKTTLLSNLKLGKVVQIIPTIGFSLEAVQYKNINMHAWEMGGRESGRAIRKHYYKFIDAVVFVIDSNDRERLQEAKERIEKELSEDLLKNHPLLIYANKQDMPNAMSVSEVENKLELQNIKDREWHIQVCCMTNGDGIYEGLDWLTNSMRKQFEIKSNVQ